MKTYNKPMTLKEILEMPIEIHYQTVVNALSDAKYPLPREWKSTCPRCGKEMEKDVFEILSITCDTENKWRRCCMDCWTDAEKELSAKPKRCKSNSRFYFRVGTVKKYLEADTELFSFDTGDSITFEEWAEKVCFTKSSCRVYVKVGSVKKELDEDTSIFTTCGGCGEEMEINFVEFMKQYKAGDTDLYSTIYYCNENCAKEEN